MLLNQIESGPKNLAVLLFCAYFRSWQYGQKVDNKQTLSVSKSSWGKTQETGNTWTSLAETDYF